MGGRGGERESNHYWGKAKFFSEFFDCFLWRVCENERGGVKNKKKKKKKRDKRKEKRKKKRKKPYFRYKLIDQQGKKRPYLCIHSLGAYQQRDACRCLLVTKAL